MAKLQMIFLGLILLLMSGCDTGDRITRLEKQNDELQAQIAKNHEAFDYDLQAKCSKDAKVWFNENWAGSRNDKDAVLLDFSNHYHKNSNKCFILVEYHFSQGSGSSWVNNMTLWNVYENSKLGEFDENHFIDYKSESKSTVFTCEVGGTKCTSLDQFNGLIQPYLNN